MRVPALGAPSPSLRLSRGPLLVTTCGAAVGAALGALLGAALGAVLLALTPDEARAQQPQVLTFDVADADAPAVRAALRDGTPLDGVRFDPGSRWLLANGNFGPVYAGQFVCHSAPLCVTPNGAGPNNTSYGTFSFVTPQPFVGAWISGPATVGIPPGIGGDPTRVYWELLLGGTVVYTSPTLAVTPTPQFLGVAYTGAVEAVRLNGDAGATVVDDIAFGAAATVPEPGTTALLGLGLVGTAGIARRRRRR